MGYRSIVAATVWCIAWLYAFAGAGNIGVYVYDLKTGDQVRNYTARLVGTGGYD